MAKTVEQFLQDQERQAVRDGYEFLCSQARLIAMLPLEQWQADLDHAEAVGPLLDPTIYRDYLESGKGEILKSILRPAIELKRAVLAAQSRIAPF